MVQEEFPLNNPDVIERIESVYSKSMRMKFVHRILIVFILLLVVGVAGFAVYIYHNSVDDYASSEILDEQVIVKIPSGATPTSLADDLVELGIVKSEKAFTEAARLNSSKPLQAGNFKIHKHLSGQAAYLELIDQLNVASLRFTIPEGKTVWETIEILVDNTDHSTLEYNKALDEIADELPPNVDSFEGWLFPETYEFDFDVDAVTIVKRMVQETYAVLEKCLVQPADYQQVLTKASIVQKEVISTADMSKVATVIDNRLEIDMVLGMDTIVGYGVTDGKGGAGLELMQTDLDDPSNPYNVRIHKGLPPTPISNPGKVAIEAVVTPEPGDWIYFVTTNPDTGETHFFTTERDFEAARSDYKAWCVANASKCLG